MFKILNPFLSYKIKNDYVFILDFKHVIASDSVAIACYKESSCSVRDCFVVPPRNDMKGIGHAELVSASHMQSIKHVIASDSVAISCYTEGICIVRDCFVVPPRNDIRGIGHAELLGMSSGTHSHLINILN